MFDIGWTELLVIGVVALLVIGPKELPEMFRTLGRFTAKVRSMARDFHRAMEAAADETGVKDVAKDLKAVTSPRSMGLDAVRNAASKFEKWEPLKPATPPAPPKPATAAPPIAPVEAKPMGPATQALAEAQAAKRAALAAGPIPKPAPEAPPPAAPAPRPRAPRSRAAMAPHFAARPVRSPAKPAGKGKS
jgi:sec-independent protein translocase protein TatB